MKKYRIHLWLELYAIALAVPHMLQGVATDEAKYLLDIPYPHPPLARSIMSWTEWMPIQEVFWRVVFASLLVQSVWFVWDMGRSLTKDQQKTLAVLWLLSAAVVLQAGTIMMAPLTALQALVFLWLLDRTELVQKYPAVVSLFWLASLFTAYQIVLFFPVVFMVFWKTHYKWRSKLLWIGVPVFLLALYTLINPLVPASVLIHGSRDLDSSLLHRTAEAMRLWVLGGSLFASVIGTTGIALSKRLSVAASFVLVFMYIALSRYDYYAILFTPLFIVGVVALPRVLYGYKSHAVVMAVVTAILCFSYGPTIQMSTARQVGQLLRNTKGTVLINGSYGHQWQYELTQPVRQYRVDRAEKAAAIVCLEACEGVPDDFEPLMIENVAVWMR